MIDLSRLQKEIADWAEEQFDKSTDPTATTCKMVEEVHELLNDSHSLEEAADIMIVMCFWLRVTGYTVDQLLEAVQTKHAINKQRKWIAIGNDLYKHDDLYEEV